MVTASAFCSHLDDQVIDEEGEDRGKVEGEESGEGGMRRESTLESTVENAYTFESTLNFMTPNIQYLDVMISHEDRYGQQRHNIAVL